MNTKPTKVPNTKQALHEIDKIIGRNIRTIRQLQGLNQDKVAQDMGITYQQVQKYETGYNRVGGSRLAQLSMIFNVAPAVLFNSVEGLADTVPIPLNFYSLRLMASIRNVTGTPMEQEMRHVIEGFLSTLELMSRISEQYYRD